MHAFFRYLSSAVVTLAVISSTLGAETKPKSTTITVEGMHCPACAKKITGKLKAIPGVSQAKADVKAGTIEVAPTKAQNPSPRALWESVEKAGYTPTKLAGPDGNFTEKPKA